MKEQAGIYYDYITFDDISDKKRTYVILKPEDFERLNRLNENIHKRISALKKHKLKDTLTVSLLEILENLIK